MATVKTLIKDILSISEEYTEKALKKFRKADLEDMLNNLNSNDGFEYAEDYVEDPTIERTLVDKDAGYDFGLDLSDGFDEDAEFESNEHSWEEEEEVQINISDLSKYEQRHYAKTGQLPQSTINRYTRFDEEEVDEGE